LGASGGGHFPEDEELFDHAFFSSVVNSWAHLVHLRMRMVLAVRRMVRMTLVLLLQMGQCMG